MPRIAFELRGLVSLGLWVSGVYEKDGFSRIEVRIREPLLFVRANPEHVVVTRDQKSSQYKWKQTLFSDLRR